MWPCWFVHWKKEHTYTHTVYHYQVCLMRLSCCSRPQKLCSNKLSAISQNKTWAWGGTTDSFNVIQVPGKTNINLWNLIKKRGERSSSSAAFLLNDSVSDYDAHTVSYTCHVSVTPEHRQDLWRRACTHAPGNVVFRHLHWPSTCWLLTQAEIVPPLITGTFISVLGAEILMQTSEHQVKTRYWFPHAVEGSDG